jgi:hypothetical protein
MLHADALAKARATGLARTHLPARLHARGEGAGTVERRWIGVVARRQHRRAFEPLDPAARGTGSKAGPSRAAIDERTGQAKVSMSCVEARSSAVRVPSTTLEGSPRRACTQTGCRNEQARVWRDSGRRIPLK